MELNDLIKLSLDYYDNQQSKYKKLLNCTNYKIQEDVITFIINIDVIKDYKFEILGYFDEVNHIWIWGWVMPEFTLRDTALIRNLLNYGLGLEREGNTKEHAILRSMFVNSRIEFHEYNELEVALAIYSYLLKENILFIYPRVIYNNKKSSGVLYYIIYSGVLYS